METEGKKEERIVREKKKLHMNFGRPYIKILIIVISKNVKSIILFFCHSFLRKNTCNEIFYFYFLQTEEGAPSILF